MEEVVDSFGRVPSYDGDKDQVYADRYERSWQDVQNIRVKNCGLYRLGLRLITS